VRHLITGTSVILSALLSGPMALAATQGERDAQAPVTLFTNVRIFDGKRGALSGPSHVLVRGNVIARVSTTPITDAGPGATVISGEGRRVLMPGLIDMHWHTLLVRPTAAAAINGDVGYLNLLGSAEATSTLMRGFTTVRDLGGPSFGLKRAIDEGIVAGPRVYPSGAMITITGGHGDFRQPSELPRTIGAPQARMELIGGSLVADSPDEVRVRVREQLMLGASQVKLTAGGGVASPHSPLDATTFTEAELRAAVEAAGNWGTYIAVHAYTPASIRRAIAAGVQCIEHAHLMDDATAKLMAERGIWLSTQPFPPEIAEAFPPDSEERAKAKQVVAGTDSVYTLAKKYKLKTAFGTDVLFSPALAQRQGALLASLTRWYTPAEVLVMATRTNAELLALSGKRNPYPGKLGVVEAGALADLLLVEGNPLENIALVADPAKNFVVIMKDGKVHKNLLAAGRTPAGAR
jgi:imidazolonepropionase-like amidohydrolase